MPQVESSPIDGYYTIGIIGKPTFGRDDSYDGHIELPSFGRPPIETDEMEAGVDDARVVFLLAAIGVFLLLISLLFLVATRCFSKRSPFEIRVEAHYDEERGISAAYSGHETDNSSAPHEISLLALEERIHYYGKAFEHNQCQCVLVADLGSDHAATTADAPRARPVPGRPPCAICLEDLRAGDTIVWSESKACPHIYHKDCLARFLAHRAGRRLRHSVGGEPDQNPCPVCRRPFVTTAATTGHRGVIGDCQTSVVQTEKRDYCYHRYNAGKEDGFDVNGEEDESFDDGFSVNGDEEGGSTAKR